jgi:sugar phosphate permease
MPSAAPTSVRLRVAAVSALAALVMYVDRSCFQVVTPKLRDRLGFTEVFGDWFLGPMFFWPYALAQIPCGTLSDRFGARRMMTIYVAVWSLCLIGVAVSSEIWALALFRIAFGIAQAGAYPTAVGAVKLWFPFTARATASSSISLGGRIGGSLAGPITLALIAFAGARLGASGLSTDQAALSIYAVVGCAVALAYFVFVRDRPELHPRVNSAERALIDDAESSALTDDRSNRTDDAVERTSSETPARNNDEVGLLDIALNPTVALAATTQFCVNIGWAFLIQKFSLLLAERHGVPAERQGLLLMAPLLIGCVGMLLGGPIVDALTRRFGRRLGRSLPIVVTQLIAAGCYVACSTLRDPWMVAATLGLMAFAVDVSNPPIWAICQDVGGKRTGAVFGFINMCGNFGAGLSPVLLMSVKRTLEARSLAAAGDLSDDRWRATAIEAGWTGVFFVAAGFFIVSAVAGWCIDSRRTVEPTQRRLTA